jgi:leucyl aminopeptidase
LILKICKTVKEFQGSPLITFKTSTHFKMPLMRSLLFGLLLLPLSSYASRWVVIDSSVVSTVAEKFPEATKQSALYLNEQELEELTNTIHTKLHRCGGYMAFDTYEEALSSMEDGSEIEGYSIDDGRYEINQSANVQTFIKEVSEPHIRAMVTELSSFPNRLYNTHSGLAAVTLISDRWKEMTKHRSDVTVEFFEHARWVQPSVILTIEGSSLPHEIVILGGHADSISESQISPGADDNASGIATMTEVLRIMMKHDYKPKRTIQIMAYAAEEVGLLGSAAIAKHYAAEKKNVLGVLQLDMTLFRGTKSKDIVLMKDFSDKKQNNFLGKLMDKYLQVEWGYSKCGYGCSDHASWTNSGFPAGFAAESRMDDMNPHIHTEKDTLEKSGGTAQHALNYARLSLSYLVELAD